MLLRISLLHTLHFPFVNFQLEKRFDLTSDASFSALGNLTSSWSNVIKSRLLLKSLYAKCVFLVLTLQLMNLNFRSYSGIRLKIKISFVYTIFPEIKLNYNNLA